MIYTSYYGRLKELKKSGIRAVATSVGVPKWAYGIEEFKMIAPPYHLVKEYNREVFKIGYIERLEKFGVSRIKSELSKYQGDTALMCYEKWDDIVAGMTFCHRRIFAEWWEEKTGLVIPEFIPREEEKTVQLCLLEV